MKLIIQVPCLNEESQLPAMLADLPREVPGFDTVEWLVIDDGSTDATIDVAKANGVDHVISFTRNKGLAAAFQAGLDACLKLGADAIVNTDADNQYSAGAIPDLVAPIAAGRADIVIGDRQVMQIDEFSFAKKRFQRLGSWVVRQASGTEVPDTTSGFRAYSRDAAIELAVINRYTYTLESIIQAGKRNQAIEVVPVATNAATRPSRLFGSMWSYMRRSAVVIFRTYAAYEPLRVFGTLAIMLFFGAVVAFQPFLWDWILNGDRSGHLQSIVLGALLMLGAIQSFAIAVVADLIASHRAVTQRMHERVRRIELAAGIPPAQLVDEGADND